MGLISMLRHRSGLGPPPLSTSSLLRNAFIDVRMNQCPQNVSGCRKQRECKAKSVQVAGEDAGHTKLLISAFSAVAFSGMDLQDRARQQNLLQAHPGPDKDQCASLQCHWMWFKCPVPAVIPPERHEIVFVLQERDVMPSRATALAAILMISS